MSKEKVSVRRTMKVKNGIIIAHRGKMYKVQCNDAHCTKHGCSLFKPGICDGEGESIKYPCDTLFNEMRRHGVVPEGGPCFKLIENGEIHG